MIAEKMERQVYDVAQKMRVLFSSADFWEHVRFCVISLLLITIIFYAVQIRNQLVTVQNDINNNVGDVRAEIESVKTSMLKQTKDITGYVKWRQQRTQTSLEDIHGVVINPDTGKVISRK